MRSHLLGISVLLAIAVLSSWIATATTDLHLPLEASALALVFGVCFRLAAHGIPTPLQRGVADYERMLIWGIVFLGASFSLSTFTNSLGRILISLAISMSFSFFTVMYLGRRFGIDPKITLLLAMGTMICGTTAVALIAPIIKSRSDQTGYAVGAIAVCGLIAMLVFPSIATLIGMTNQQFGVLAGMAVHSTTQVVGAGYLFSEDAGTLATAVKLLRNCAMAPMAVIIAIWSNRSMADDAVTAKQALVRSFPWFIFLYFFMAFLGSNQLLPHTILAPSIWIGKTLIVMALAGIGMSTDLNAMRSLGTKPIYAALIASSALGMVAYLLATLFVYPS